MALLMRGASSETEGIVLTPSGINPCPPGDDESVSEVWDLERAAYEFSRLGGQLSLDGRAQAGHLQVEPALSDGQGGANFHSVKMDMGAHWLRRGDRR